MVGVLMKHLDFCFVFLLPGGFFLLLYDRAIVRQVLNDAAAALAVVALTQHQQ
jgi:hypothetical protein